MEVYYERSDFDEEIDRETVLAETDLAKLSDWSEHLRLIESELHTMISSIKLADECAPVAMARKLGYIRIARNWINDRIHSLGGEVPTGALGSKMKRLKHHLTCANQQLEKRNKQIKELRARVAELEADRVAA